MPKERHADCYIEGASDVPAAGRKSGQPTKQQMPGKSNRQRSGPQKGETGRGSLRKARWKKPPAMICWEASDQHGKAKRHPSGGWRFARLGHVFRPSGPAPGPRGGIVLVPAGSQVTCKPVRQAVLSKTEAYQAADANHPKLGSESSPLKKDVSPAGLYLNSGSERRKLP